MACREERHVYLLHANLVAFTLGVGRSRCSLPIARLVARQTGITRLRSLRDRGLEHLCFLIVLLDRRMNTIIRGNHKTCHSDFILRGCVHGQVGMLLLWQNSLWLVLWLILLGRVLLGVLLAVIFGP